MMRHAKQAIPILLGLAALALPPDAAVAQTADASPRADAVELAAPVVGGVVMLRGALDGPQGALQANLVLDLGSAAGLVVPPDRAAALSLKPGGRASLTIGELRLDDVPVAEADAAEIAGSLSRDHAAELRQVPVIGVVGLGAFAGRPVTLDVGAQTLRVGPLAAAADAPRAATIVAIEPGDTPSFRVDGVSVGLDMLRQESLATPAAAERLKLGHPDAAVVRLGTVDLVAADAFRIDPRPAGASTPDLRLGVRLLGSFRVAIDPAARSAAFELVRPPSPPPVGEQAFFLALHRADADGIAAFVERDPDSRLATEAATALLQALVNDRAASPESIAAAVRRLANAFPMERRSRQLLGLADEMMQRQSPRFSPIIRQMLSVAAESARGDVDARATHDVYARQGALALRDGDLREARRLLISAAYRLPRDPQVNAWMGDLYRQLEQPTRAWARYTTAALADGPTPPAALRGLDVIVRDERFRAESTIDDVELMLEGRAPAFAPPRPRTANQAPRVRLVELFVDDAAGGCVGPQLAFDGLRQFCAGTPTAFVAFHFGPAGNASLAAARARFYGRATLPATLGDGEPLSEVAAGPKDAPALYDALIARAITDAPATAPAAPPQLSATAAWTDGTLRATLDFRAEPAPPSANDLRLFAFAVERRVFAIGGSGTAMHYQVARAAIGDAAGQSINLDSTTGRQSFTLELAGVDLRASADRGDAARARQNPTAPAMRTVPPNAAECGVVAFIQDVRTKRVLAAVTLEPGEIGGRP